MLARRDGFPTRIGRPLVCGACAQLVPVLVALNLPDSSPVQRLSLVALPLACLALSVYWLARVPWCPGALVPAATCPSYFPPWLAGSGGLAGWRRCPCWLAGWPLCASILSRAGPLSDRSTHPPGGSVLVNIFPATQTSLSFLIISFYPFFECGVDLH